MKTCTKCGGAKPLSSFSPDKRRSDGRRSVCKECERARSSAYSKSNPEARRDTRLRHYYGISLSDYTRLLSDQGNKCAVCGAPECATGKSFAVDHDHACCSGTRSCGKCIRGLLCLPCNTALGNFRDSPDLLRAAIEYLSRSE
ncbi:MULTISPECIES: endonuclease domain-containing protein [unclassified Streptomyces]|uniref:endonuclease VII domain-containing protein n=1 Tax=unclassified Streptomyces TaxID=2593676 RepID=UPI0004C1AADE